MTIIGSDYLEVSKKKLEKYTINANIPAGKDSITMDGKQVEDSYLQLCKDISSITYEQSFLVEDVIALFLGKLVLNIYGCGVTEGNANEFCKTILLELNEAVVINWRRIMRRAYTHYRHLVKILRPDAVFKYETKAIYGLDEIYSQSELKLIAENVEIYKKLTRDVVGLVRFLDSCAE